MKKILFFGLALMSIVSCKKEIINPDSSNRTQGSKNTALENEKNTTIVWGLGHDNRVYRWNGSTVTWTEPTPSMALADISVGQSGDGAVWGLGADGRVYRRVEAGNYWEEPNITMRLHTISTVSSSEVWATRHIGSQAFIYKTTNGGTTWVLVPATGLPNFNGQLGLHMVRATPKGVLGLGRDFKLYKFNATTNQWSLHSTNPSNPSNSYRCITGILFDNSIWAAKFGGLNGDLYHYLGLDPIFSSQWTIPNIDAETDYISANYDGEVWGVSSSKHVYKWNNSYWIEPSPTARMEKVSVGN